LFPNISSLSDLLILAVDSLVARFLASAIMCPLQDNVFVRVDCAVQCEPKKDKIKDAIYKLRSPVDQIDSYVGDVVRVGNIYGLIWLQLRWVVSSRAHTLVVHPVG
jgi:regulator of protease activity HflC (stomatin/prohibitin superfamily)